MRSTKNKRRFAILAVLLLLTLLVIPVSAHSGGTDANGGHYDAETGEYHYHHGYSAHQHPGGECPYEFKNNEVYTEPAQQAEKSDSDNSSSGWGGIILTIVLSLIGGFILLFFLVPR